VSAEQPAAVAAPPRPARLTSRAAAESLPLVWRPKTRRIATGRYPTAGAADESLHGLPADATALLESWRWKARTANVAHLRATDSLTWRNFALGGTAAVLGALVGLSVFASLQSSHMPLGVRIAAGATAFAAAGSAALWKYLGYGARVELHRSVSRSYGNTVRQLDDTLAHAHARGHAPSDDTIENIRKALDQIDTKAPNVSPSIWAWALSVIAIEQQVPGIDASGTGRGALSRAHRLLKRTLR